MLIALTGVLVGCLGPKGGKMKMPGHGLIKMSKMV